MLNKKKVYNNLEDFLRITQLQGHYSLQILSLNGNQIGDDVKQRLSKKIYI